MKVFLKIAVCMFFSTSIAIAQHGVVYDNLSLESKLLKSERKFAIYLPAGYETSQRSYPVLYLLHGGGDDQTGWVQFGEVEHIADNAINGGIATPMIIVMPDANTTKRGYFNSVDNSWKYEDFFFQELIPYIEKNYRAKTEKRYRAVAGLSMGGGGTYFYAMHRPDMFSSACPLSASLRTGTIEQLKESMDKSKEPYTPDQLKTYFDRHNALSQLDIVPIDSIKSVRWYFDIGDDDFLYEGNSQVHIAMRKKEIPHEFRIRDGKHSWVYWRASLPNVLEFVSEAFHQN